MSEEAKVVETPTEPVVAESKEVELSPVEIEAMDQGWMPKEDWVANGNDPNDHRSAKEFVERGELYRSLSHTRGELKRTQMALGALQKHHQHVFEMAHQKALNELKQEKRAAIRNDDMETAEAIDEEIEQLKTSHQNERMQMAVQEQAVQQANSMPPEWEAWRSKNAWYDTDGQMKDEADSIGLVFLSKRPGTPPAQVLEYVEKEIKRRYPEKFNGKRAAPNAVAGVDRTTTRKGPAVAEVELDDMEREVMRQLVSSGEMTEQQYKAELRKAKGIK